MENKETKKVSKLEKIKEIKKIKQERKRKIITISAISMVAIILIALISIFTLDATQKTFGGKIASIHPIFTTDNETVSKVASIFSQDKEITEEEATTKALDRFNEMGEENLSKDNLEVLKILRSGEYYYYISSPDNSLEIRISDGKIVRENSVLVEE